LSDASDLYFAQIPVGQMANLAYLVGSRSTREALVVDPAWSVDALLDQAEADDMRVVGALVTHYHQDHVGGSIFGMEIEGVARLLERAPMPIYVNEHEADGTRKVTGASTSDLISKVGGDVIELGPIRVRLLHTPGHTPGSQCFLVEEAGQPGKLISGDTLFLGSCGRVDLPGADPAEMYRSLNERLKRLPDETLLFPGHLYSAESWGRLGDEKRTNPFMRVASLDQFLMFMGA
jgi:glyoxylase-like metal-dependent hydrolase (beta-lactamase superfamily II)